MTDSLQQEGELIEDYLARIGQWQDERSLPIYSALDAGPMVENAEEARLSALEIQMKVLDAKVDRLASILAKIPTTFHAQW